MAKDDDDWFVQDGADDDAPTLATPPPGSLLGRPPPVGGAPQPISPWEGGGPTQPHPGIGGGAPVPEAGFDLDDGPTAIHTPSQPTPAKKKGIPGARRAKLPSQPPGQAVSGTGEHPRSGSGEAPFTPPGSAPSPAGGRVSLDNVLEVTETPASPSGEFAGPTSAQPMPPTMTPPGGVAAPNLGLGTSPSRPGSTPPTAAPQPPASKQPAAAQPATAQPATLDASALRPVASVSETARSTPPGTTPPDAAQQGFDPFGEASFSNFNQAQAAPLAEAARAERDEATDAPDAPSGGTPSIPVPSPASMIGQGSIAGDGGAMGAVTYVGVPSVDGVASVGMLGALFAIIVAALRTFGVVQQSFSSGEHVGMPWGAEAWLQAGAADAARALLSGDALNLVEQTVVSQGYQPSAPLAWLHAGAQAVFGTTAWAPYAALSVPLAFGLWYLFRAAAPQSLAVRATLVVAIASLPISRTLLLTLSPEGWAGMVLGAALLWLLGARGPRTRATCAGMGALAGLALAVDPGHAYVIGLVTLIAFVGSVAVGRLRASRHSGEIIQHAGLWLLGWAAVGLPFVIASRAWVSEAFRLGIARAGDASASANLKALFGVVWEQGGVVFVVLASLLTLLAVATERRGGSVVALLRQVCVALALVACGLFAGATDETRGPTGWIFVSALLVVLTAGMVGGLGRARQLLGDRGPVVAGGLAAVIVTGTLFTGSAPPPLDMREQRALHGHLGLVDRAYAAMRRAVLTNPRLRKQGSATVVLTPVQMKSGWWGSAHPYLKARAARDGLPARIFEAREKTVNDQVGKADVVIGWAPDKFLQEGQGGVARKATDRANASAWFDKVWSEPHPNQGISLVLYARRSSARKPPAAEPAEQPAAEQPTPKADAKGGQAEPEKAGPGANRRNRGAPKGNRRRRRR